MCRNIYWAEICCGTSWTSLGQYSQCQKEDEFHTRLRFCRRDLITMANVGKDDNGSQFFFTLNCTPELQNKHTIFGEVTGESIYSMLKLEEALADENDRPLCPPILIKTIILNNPFSDTILRIIVQESEEEKDNSKTKTAAVKDFNLLSFGEEAEEDEEESVILNKKFSGKGESPHDHLTDPKLSLQPAVEPSGLASKKRKEVRISDWENDDELKTEEELAVDEFHTRLRFCCGDLNAMANAGKDDNGSQFFFTLSCTPELQNKHTIFGEVTGESIYSMLKLEEALADENDRLLYPPRLVKAIILNNPFSDIIPRITAQECEVKVISETEIAGVKDFNLLSFGEEAEEDEEESVI
ncbi:Peptidyl-prolyl cis-trans isomerase CWC27 like protein [Eufriesea mexicana]|uniref:Spliceosome-associated protein CWC27 homolog n=1 Tax=Eufriesea mexicana TaxID=516756 RepID=A0A310SB79_9HYME|nr:Peptidyl-prolyl cis-trans isomerase CWC27 like protein [Eufriesea mexicana]